MYRAYTSLRSRKCKTCNVKKHHVFPVELILLKGLKDQKDVKDHKKMWKSTENQKSGDLWDLKDLKDLRDLKDLKIIQGDPPGILSRPGGGVHPTCKGGTTVWKAPPKIFSNLADAFYQMVTKLRKESKSTIKSQSCKCYSRGGNTATYFHLLAS